MIIYPVFTYHEEDIDRSSRSMYMKQLNVYDGSGLRTVDVSQMRTYDFSGCPCKEHREFSYVDKQFDDQKIRLIQSRIVNEREIYLYNFHSRTIVYGLPNIEDDRYVLYTLFVPVVTQGSLVSKEYIFRRLEERDMYNYCNSFPKERHRSEM